jgi:transcriptional regulator with XRE-family HTH domain
MDSAEDIWKEHLRTLGEYIKAQRQMNQLTQRELARLADLSDTYMSQLERGLHEPSIRVLKSLAESLGIRPDQLIMYASGLPTNEADVDTEEAIRRDARLTAAQRRAMGSVLRSYLDDNKS